MNKLDMESKDIVKDNLEYIKKRFPEAVTEENGELKLNPDSLIQSLSSVIIDDKKEKYELTWPGKRQSIVEGNARTSKTLRPLKDKSVDFDKTKNIYIEGDNLDALKILQESYLNKIDCIYIDPPYNTGNDFVYKDDFKGEVDEELLESGQIDEYGNKLITNSQSNGRFHSDWLSMMYPRLKLARNLLSNKNGVIFMSIDDNEYDNLKKISDEIFGEKNYIGTICWQKKTQPSFLSKKISSIKEYILMYCKDNPGLVTTMGGFTDENKLIEMINISNQKADRVLRCNNVLIENGKYNGLLKAGIYGNGDLQIELKNDVEITNGKPTSDLLLNGRFKWNQETMNISFDEGDIYHIKNTQSLRPTVEKKNKVAGIKPILDLFSKKLNDEIPTNTDATNEIKKLFDGYGIMDYPKPSKLIKYLIRSVTYDKKDAVVMDFFSGSATTADAVFQQNVEDDGNRSFILVQIPEKFEYKDDKIEMKSICDMGEERIRRAGKKIKEEFNVNIDYGFRVYKIDDSNMKDEFYMTPDKISQEQIRLFEDNIKEDRTPDDLLTQVLLNLGLKLDLSIEEKIISGNKVYDVDEGELLACFDNNVNIDIIEEIAKINPRQVVFRDSSFATDQDKVNFEERLKRLSAGTKFNVL